MTFVNSPVPPIWMKTCCLAILGLTVWLNGLSCLPCCFSSTDTCCRPPKAQVALGTTALAEPMSERDCSECCPLVNQTSSIEVCSRPIDDLAMGFAASSSPLPLSADIGVV